MSLNYKPLFVKKLQSGCNLKGSLYGGRKLLSESRSWLSSFIYARGGEREFVSGLGSMLSSTHGKGLCLRNNMQRNKWAWTLYKVWFNFQQQPIF